MKSADLVTARRRAEEAVADMAEGELKVTAFSVILQSLLSTGALEKEPPTSSGRIFPDSAEVPSSLADRVSFLANEGFFAQPRSLAEIQAALAEHGWHYPQTSLGTPLVRLVRQRRLRRIHLSEGNKKVWKYSLP